MPSFSLKNVCLAVKIVTAGTAMFLAACGDGGTTENITQNYTTGLDIVASAEDLPKCSLDNEGDQVLVKDEGVMRYCLDGKWVALEDSAGDTLYVSRIDTIIALNADTVYVSRVDTILVSGTDTVLVSNTDTLYIPASSDYSCATKNLADDSGFAIYCGGDSIGVVYNGATGAQGEKGETGATGADCSVASSTDTTVLVRCGDYSFVMKLNGGSTPIIESSASTDFSSSSTVVYEVENIDVTGVSQKGPFVNGSKVTLYELVGNRTLSQTGRVFGGNITTDDGKFTVNNVSLVSGYARLEATGFYRNEVTGKNSDAEITLNAYTDLGDRQKVNINLLTHLEYYRVNYLMANSDGTLKIKTAKKLAEREIFKSLFDIDASGFGYSEDLDVFGTGDGDAALLALSILLQGDRSEADLSILLAAFGQDVQADGVWDGTTFNNSARTWRDSIADWSLETDLAGSFATYRKNVESWGLGDVPAFEKYIRKYYSTELGLGICGDDVDVRTVKHVSNKNSSHYASSYTSTNDAGGKARYICDSDAKVWRAATDIEKDTMGMEHGSSTTHNQTSVINGLINTDYVYVYENSAFRRGTALDSSLGLNGCTAARQDTVALSDGIWYKCVGDTSISNYYGLNGAVIKSAWREATDIEKDTAGWGHDFNEGDVRNGKINATITYVYEDGNWRLGTTIDSLMYKQKVNGGKACIKDALTDTSKVKANNLYYVCSSEGAADTAYHWIVAPAIYNDTYEDRGKCGETEEYNDGRIINGRINKNNKYTCDADEFRIVSDTYELFLNKSCVSYLLNSSETSTYNNTQWNCLVAGTWTYVTGQKPMGTILYQDQTYMTVAIGTQLWFAENLNYDYNEGNVKSYCYNNSADSCVKYGRLYSWAAAMDSAAVFSENGKGCGRGTVCTVTEPARGICPEGWHIPSVNEWNTLFSFVGGMGTSGTMLKSANGWIDGGNGKDAYGFSVLPAGYYYNGSFSGLGESSFFWTSTEYDKSNAHYESFVYDFSFNQDSHSYKYRWTSVRCLKNF